MSGATPRPWSYEDRRIITPNGELLSISGISTPCGVVPLDDGSYANAALIVRCVNSHDALAAALKELLRVDDDWHGAVNSEMAHARSQARIALKLAGDEL